MDPHLLNLFFVAGFFSLCLDALRRGLPTQPGFDFFLFSDKAERPRPRKRDQGSGYLPTETIVVGFGFGGAE